MLDIFVVTLFYYFNQYASCKIDLNSAILISCYVYDAIANISYNLWRWKKYLKTLNGKERSNVCNIL